MRGEKIVKLGKKSEKYFENQHIYESDKWNSKKECLFLALDDENIPKECYTKEQLESAIYVGPKSHIGMINCTSDKFRDELIKFIWIN